MKKLFTESQYDKSKSMDKLELICYNCNSKFLAIKKLISQEIKHNRGRLKFCSQKCNNELNNKTKHRDVFCLNCEKNFLKSNSQIKKTPKNFCSRSCSISFNNKHKTTGNRRSKLEIWLEEQLTTLYTNLEIHYNQKSTINSELDIYIPSLNIAFELNGIFHYEPIYGVNKLQQIKENDISKSKACHEAKIDLCIIDTSGQKYFKPSTSQKYLDIIDTIIKERISIV
jgi:hypothetical protein